ncbi:MAG TPA: DUF4189 domain-containing protein [Xanthobacteraceae bacterium]|jgi:hypothetical protein|nr:DUF4189 domain-containing protein [Xanthobacteraceae bacterium]
MLKGFRTVARFAPLAVLVCGTTLTPTQSHSEAALAFGQYGNGAWASGTAYDYRTVAEAQSSAMNSCNARGYNCSIQVTFRKSCIALAVQSNGSGNGWQVHQDLSVAQSTALRRCASYGQPCSIKAAFCDNVSEQEIRAAEAESQRRQKEEYQEYFRHWRQCFDGTTFANDRDSQVSNCNQALGYPHASYEDRNKLIQQRDNLLSASEQNRRQAEERVTNAEQSATEHTDTVSYSPSNNLGFQITPNSNSAVGLGLIFVGFMSWTFSLLAKAAGGEKRVLWREIAVESIAGVISGIVLYKLGIVNEIKLLAVPLVGGLGIALYSSVRYA